MKALAIGLLALIPIFAEAQGTIIYRTGAEMISNYTLVDVNKDGVAEFDFRNVDFNVGENFQRDYSLGPLVPTSTFPDSAGEVMMNSFLPFEIEWAAGQTVLPDPGAGARWTGAPLDMSFMLAAVRIRSGNDWNYGWLRFEKVGQDSIGDIWALRDGAYNSALNSPINMLQVPEPSTCTLLAGGGAFLGIWFCRNESASQGRQ